MTVNRVSANSVKRELLPVLLVQFKAVYSTSGCRLNKAETNYLHCKALQLVSLCSLSLPTNEPEILFQLSWLFHWQCTLFMTKFYFLSLPLFTDSLFSKAVRGKSSNPYDRYFYSLYSHNQGLETNWISWNSAIRCNNNNGRFIFDHAHFSHFSTMVVSSMISSLIM